MAYEDTYDNLYLYLTHSWALILKFSSCPQAKYQNICIEFFMDILMTYMSLRFPVEWRLAQMNCFCLLPHPNVNKNVLLFLYKKRETGAFLWYQFSIVPVSIPVYYGFNNDTFYVTPTDYLAEDTLQNCLSTGWKLLIDNWCSLDNEQERKRNYFK